MYFHSISYLCFLPIVLFALSRFSVNDRWKAILASSLFFYSWISPWVLIYLLFVVVVSYLIGQKLENSKSYRSTFLWVAIVFFVINIAVAKYFFADNLIVPIGLSFYSFQAIGYLIDVYRRTRKFENHFGIHAAYVCFFPTLLSGPIERADALIPQIQKPSVKTAEETEKHLLLFYSGLFKKLVIADALAKSIVFVFQNPSYYSGFTLFFAIALARYMIFADFSGYSDIAVASAGLLGIRIRQNFMRPFFATSLIDYWRRWHISLHDWMKDYVFFSLSTSALGRTFGIYFCLLVSFIFMGVWHDVGPTFLAVGLWHGIFISLDYKTRHTRERFITKIGLNHWPTLNRIISIIITFVFFVMPPTVFFLSKNLESAETIFRQIFANSWSLEQIINSVSILSGNGPVAKARLVQALVAIMCVEILHIIQAKRGSLRDDILRLPYWARGILYILLFVILILYGQTFGERPYTYFQF